MSASKKITPTAGRAYTDVQLATKYNTTLGKISILAGQCEIIKRSVISIQQKSDELEKIQNKYNVLLSELSKLNNIKQQKPSYYILSQQQFVKGAGAIKQYGEKSSSLDLYLTNHVSPHNFSSPRSHSS